MMKLETLRKWYLINENSFLSYSFFLLLFYWIFCAKINVKKIGENWQVYRAHVFIPYTIKKMEGFCGLSMARCKKLSKFQYNADNFRKSTRFRIQRSQKNHEQSLWKEPQEYNFNYKILFASFNSELSKKELLNFSFLILFYLFHCWVSSAVCIIS